MAPALQILANHGHTVHRVPGLEPIIRDDIIAFPNYTNGVLLNQAALVPVYGRREDQVVQEILRNYGYEVYPIDCSDIILTNSAIHCISKTAPKMKIGPQTWTVSLCPSNFSVRLSILCWAIATVLAALRHQIPPDLLALPPLVTPVTFWGMIYDISGLGGTYETALEVNLRFLQTGARHLPGE
jgi:hypothetical protein